jgi:hypothetical protein
MRGKNRAACRIWSVFVSLSFASERRSVANKQEYTRSDTARASWTRDCICSKIFLNWTCGVVITSGVSCKLSKLDEGVKRPETTEESEESRWSSLDITPMSRKRIFLSESVLMPKGGSWDWFSCDRWWSVTSRCDLLEVVGRHRAINISNLSQLFPSSLPSRQKGELASRNKWVCDNAYLFFIQSSFHMFSSSHLFLVDTSCISYVIL